MSDDAFARYDWTYIYIFNCNLEYGENSINKYACEELAQDDLPSNMAADTPESFARGTMHPDSPSPPAKKVLQVKFPLLT